MAIDFPNSPVLDEQFTAGGNTWIWDGTAWTLQRISTGQQGPAGAGYDGITSSSLVDTTNLGSLTFTLNKIGALAVNNRVRVASSNSKWVEGVISSIVSSDITVNVDLAGTTGEFDSWIISIAGQPGVTGPQGIQGIQGETGPAGVISTNTAVTGLIENASIVSSATSGAININAKTSTIYYYTTGSTSSFTLNVRGDGSTTLNSMINTGQSITVVFLNTTGASTGSYPTSFAIDGTTVTPKWVVGVAPTAGNSNSIDAYTYTIFKTGSATYSVLASQTRYA